MFEIAGRLAAALDAGRPLAIATAIAIDGSAPRTVGTSMAFDGERVIGSIAGGCVEGAVVEVCERVLEDGVARTVEYGVSDETALSVGLTCGGRLRIHVRLVTAVDPTVDRLREALTGAPTGVASVIAGDAAAHGQRVAAELRSRIALGESALTTIDCGDALVEVFFEVAVAPPRLIVFGAMEFSAALAAAASAVGYRVTVCDPRRLFATEERFPGVELVVAWPPRWLAGELLTSRDVVCVLSHDARFDAELVAAALASAAGFVGAMGSRRTHDRRVASLRELGVAADAITRLRSPIGLDLGASTPAETAVSILAEVIADRTRASAARLSLTAGAIHADQPAR
ncbi:MAG TPA: XshC-Cox1-family protein [Microbacteriaceae bacterium]|nr:XshC-Cox1-family protein [Microbacteriaceae bacterium]